MTFTSIVTDNYYNEKVLPVLKLIDSGETIKDMLAEEGVENSTIVYSVKDLEMIKI